ncbi:hypothetical protein [Spirillospora sp. CA-294931]|uniref:hypothetical protein n=1 Tax=Spirillospora sp. CA-294931 TaxID=3240042 RepID=UPI003D924937
MDWSAVITYGVGYGVALGVAFTVAVFAGAAASRDFLLNDYPRTIQDRYGRPKSARGRRVAIVFGVAVWGGCGLPLMTMAMVGLDGALDDGLDFPSAAVCAALVFATLSLWDLVVLDWIILAGFRPRLLVLPGTEGMKEYRDLRFHLVAALKGSPAIAVVGLVTATVATLLA